jgi:hypothetical protein
MPAFCKGELPHYAQLCVDFWRRWCDKNSAEFIMTMEHPADPEKTPCTVQKLYAYDILEANNIEYDQCALVDWDTFPMPNAKNIFDYTDNKFAVCLDYGYATNIIRSIEYMQQFFPGNNTVTWDNYFNSGLYVFNKSHKAIFDKTREFCLKHDEVRKKNPELFHGDQTTLNYIVHATEKVTILPRSFMVHEHFLKIFLNNYTDHHNNYIDAQSYMTHINFVHITDGEEFRNMLVDLVNQKFYS